MNKIPDRNIIISDHGDVNQNNISHEDNIIKNRINELYRLNKSYDVKSKNKKERGDTTASNVKKTSSNITSQHFQHRTKYRWNTSSLNTFQ